jgi:hypothetical protein
MKSTTRFALAVFLPFMVTGCLSNNTAVQQGSIMVSEVVSICGAMVGGPGEARINQEWAKYPQAEVSRPMVETMAKVLLNNPEIPEQDRVGQYKKYMSCAAGLFAVNQVSK